MRILIAPDSFKGTYTASQVAAAIARGVRTFPGVDAVELPVADGGEGTLEALKRPWQLASVRVATCNPWGAQVTAEYGLSAPDGRGGDADHLRTDGPDMRHGDLDHLDRDRARVAVIELAAACGINTAHDGTRDPVTASTLGTGLMALDALRRGARHLVFAAGGTATTDGGAGFIEAVGTQAPPGTRMSVLTDVRTRFLHAPSVYGPQKGATDADVITLTRRLRALADALPRDPREVDGGGAAGGFAGGLWARYGAHIVPGARTVLDAVGFPQHLARADALVVGEGRLDAQTSEGKIIAELLARRGTLPTYAVVGSLGAGVQALKKNLQALHVATDQPAMEHAGFLIAEHLTSARTSPGSR